MYLFAYLCCTSLSAWCIFYGYFYWKVSARSIFCAFIYFWRLWMMHILCISFFLYALSLCMMRFVCIYLISLKKIDMINFLCIFLLVFKVSEEWFFFNVIICLFMLCISEWRMGCLFLFFSPNDAFFFNKSVFSCLWVIQFWMHLFFSMFLRD